VAADCGGQAEWGQVVAGITLKRWFTAGAVVRSRPETASMTRSSKEIGTVATETVKGEGDAGRCYLSAPAPTVTSVPRARSRYVAVTLPVERPSAVPGSPRQRPYLR
jgi:hypothetical protein